MTQATHDETALITALRARDEVAFAGLVDLHTPSMLRVAGAYVPSAAIAEEVVQETWIALLKGIDSFEGRSSLRTWLFAVLINIAKRRGVRERRGQSLRDPRARPHGGVSRGWAGRAGRGCRRGSTRTAGRRR